MNVMEELLGLPTGALEEIPASTPKTDPLESEDIGQFLLDFSETIWQNMSEEHRRKSMACSEYIARMMELERLRLRAKVLGVEIPPEPIPVSKGDLEKAAEEIRRSMDELDRLLNASDEEKGGGRCAET